jgi:hypothetical protein
MSLGEEPPKESLAPFPPEIPTSLEEQPAPLGNINMDEHSSMLQGANTPPAHMSLDEPSPQLTAPNPPGQHPGPTPDSPIIAPLGDMSNALSNQAATEVESGPLQEVSPATLDLVVHMGVWFCIEFTGVSADVNMKQMFLFLIEDCLIGI